MSNVRPHRKSITVRRVLRLTTGATTKLQSQVFPCASRTQICQGLGRASRTLNSQGLVCASHTLKSQAVACASHSLNSRSVEGATRPVVSHSIRSDRSSHVALPLQSKQLEAMLPFLGPCLAVTRGAQTAVLLECGLTLPSRGQSKGCAFCLPLMSNVRHLGASPQPIQSGDTT